MIGLNFQVFLICFAIFKKIIDFFEKNWELLLGAGGGVTRPYKPIIKGG